MNPLTFVSSYDSNLKVQIDFDWNGKHADEFQDRNQQFRRAIIEFS